MSYYEYFLFALVRTSFPKALEIVMAEKITHFHINIAE